MTRRDVALAAGSYLTLVLLALLAVYALAASAWAVAAAAS